MVRIHWIVLHSETVYPDIVTEIRDQVIEFHQAGNVPIGTHPKIPETDRLRLRAKLITEEYIELMRALFPEAYDLQAIEGDLRRIAQTETPKPDMVAFADACADLDYVVEGSRLEFGIDGGPIAREVQRSNMSKFGPGSWVREDGKIMKPPDWSPPDVEGLLWEQGWEGPAFY